jgi:hypothetical protein
LNFIELNLSIKFMKIPFLKKIIVLGALLLLSNCTTNETKTDALQLTISAASTVTTTTANVNVTIANGGSSNITAKGICWSTSTNPTITLNTKTNDGTGNSAFNAVLNSLAPGTTYYVRAYATKSSGTVYSLEITFTTGAVLLPTLTTTTVSGLTTNSAISGGTIITDGGGSITARGVVWNTGTNPTVLLNTKTTDGTGTGNFISTIANLTTSTNYYARAYATNSAGTAYGNEITFTTKTPVLPTLITSAVSNITSNSTVSGGTITDDGGAAITARGVIWSTSQNPTITLSTKTTDGIGTGTFSSAMVGLTPNTTYYVRAFATNGVGTAYGSQLSFITLTSKFAAMYPAGTVFCNNLVTDVVDVTNPITGKIWMDRNLGATRVATSANDVYSYGDSYQWGRRSDGHQCRNSIETNTLSSTDQPSNGSFIATLVGGNNDWRSPQNNNLWQGVNGQNNPCPSGYRLPTETEFEAERLSWNSGGFASPLKLTKPGVRGTSGSFGFVGTIGNYWSSTIFKYDSRTLWVTGNNNDGSISQYVRGVGSSVRCIKN